MVDKSITYAKSWLAFELNILGRLKFNSVAIPFTNDPAIGIYLKRRGVRVSANDLLMSSWIKAVAAIQNNRERLTDDQVNVILNDVYVPGYKLRNPALRKWFSEIDSWWFDNIRANLDLLDSPTAFAIGAGLTIAVGNYVRSFTDETRELRQPLSNVFRRLWTMLPDPVNNHMRNTCHNKPANVFLAGDPNEDPAELMFLRLPVSPFRVERGFSESSVWGEEWIRGGDDFWGEIEAERANTFGTPTRSKSQYLEMLDETLEIASNKKTWVISFAENDFFTTEELLDAIGRGKRPVNAVYTKDFTELTGSKAVIITASAKR